MKFIAAIIILLHSASTGVSAATEDSVAKKDDDRLGQRSLKSPSCESTIGDGCWSDSGCCGEEECLGVNPYNWACGNTPGTVGEYCDTYYYCGEDIVCYEGICTDYKDILENGSNGDCKEGSQVGEIKVMTYNLFLISCEQFGIDGARSALGIPCEPADVQRERIVAGNALGNFIDNSEADVVLFQEVWSLHDEIIGMMASAGFCNYISSVRAFRETGAGLMIFSKYPIEALDFNDWYDPSLTDIQPCNLFTDKGVMYAKVRKDGQIFHITNTHTSSDTAVDMHTYRLEEFLKMRQLVGENNPSTTDIVLYGGDMNENKYTHDVTSLEITQYYLNMLRELGAVEPEVLGDQQFSYDTVNNPIPRSFQDNTFQELLDFVLVSTEYSQPTQSSCEILTPVMLSDHFPVLCTYGYNAGSILDNDVTMMDRVM